MAYNDWLQQARNNDTYIQNDTILIDINKTSEEIYNHNTDKLYQEEAGIYDGNNYHSAISRERGTVNPPHAFLHCSDGIYLAVAPKDTENLLRSGFCQLNIKFL